MNEPNAFDDDPFDAELAGLFQAAAEAETDDGFSRTVVARVRRQGAIRVAMLAAASGVGAIAAAAQLGPAWRLASAQFDRLAAGVPNESEAVASLSAAVADAGVDWGALATSPLALGVAMLAVMAGVLSAGASAVGGR